MNTALLAVLLVTQAGLASKDVVRGTGTGAMNGDVLTVEYVGKLKDGSEFDSTTDKPPFAFRLGEGKVIRGWDVGLLGMKVGGVRKLSVPPTMAYGDKALGTIPAKSTLLFEVRLLRVDSKNVKPKIELKELAPGSGPAVKSGDTVTVHYSGLFVNGVKFDASYDRNEPFKVATGAKKVIAGFDQGLMGMKVGGKRKVTIPYALAYGEKGRPPVIPAMATLVFEIELLKIE